MTKTLGAVLIAVAVLGSAPDALAAHRATRSEALAMYRGADRDCLRGEVNGVRGAIISSYDELYGQIEVRCRLEVPRRWKPALMERSTPEEWVPVFAELVPCAIVEAIRDLPVVRLERKCHKGPVNG